MNDNNKKTGEDSNAASQHDIKKITEISPANHQVMQNTLIAVDGNSRSSMHAVAASQYSPPPWLLWVTVVVSLATFVWRFISYILQRAHSISDDFWYRTITIPICVNPLVNHVEAVISELRNLDASSNKNLYTEYLAEYKINKNSIASKFFLIDDGELYKNVTSIVDEMEDIITQYCAYSALGNDSCCTQDYSDLSIVEQHLYKKLKDLLVALEAGHKKKHKW